MTTSIDTNIIIGLWNPDDSSNLKAFDALAAALAHGRVVICGAVYGELIAYPTRTEKFIDTFLDEIDISVDWLSSETIWRTAGDAFQKYARRRRRQRSGDPRRILTDFYIGAHAFCNGYKLLTLDDKIYKAAFPKLSIVKA
jgi:predicted nucleic acid-binding protein